MNLLIRLVNLRGTWLNLKSKWKEMDKKCKEILNLSLLSLYEPSKVGVERT